jgi:L-amino acid N-acyltransferase YncA
VRYPKECVLKDCQEVTIRPLAKDDQEILQQFYTTIPQENLWYLRYDVKDPKVLRKWFDNMKLGLVDSIIAVCDDKLVGHGTLHLRGFGCSRHVGRFRIITLPEFRQQRLGTWLMLDLIQLAMDKGLEQLRSDLVVGPEDATIDACRKFDFFKCASLPDYAKDPDGALHDMVIMIKHLHRGYSDF